MIEPRATLRGTGRQFLSVAFSADGRHVAAGQQDGAVTMWDTASMAQRTIATRKNVPLYDFSDTVLTVAFSPDSRLLAWGGGDKQVTLFDLEKGRIKSVNLFGN
jgi:WD40 repeat protein